MTGYQCIIVIFAGVSSNCWQKPSNVSQRVWLYHCLTINQWQSRMNVSITSFSGIRAENHWYPHTKVSFRSNVALSQQTIDTLFIQHDLQRLEAYTRNQIEYRLILDLTTDFGKLIFEGKLNDVPIDSLQKAILLGIGLQNKSLDKLSEEFNMPVNQMLAKFFDCCKKLSKKLESVNESTIEKTMIQESSLNTGESMKPTAQTFAEELEAGARELAKAQKKELKRLKNENLSAYKIKGTDEEWGKALANNKSGIISVKR